MKELIDKWAAIDALKSTLPDEPPKSEFKQGFAVGIALGSLYIAAVPSEEPEQKTGRWINGKCNQCGEHAPFWPMASTYYRSNYCPNCGSYNGVRFERSNNPVCK